MNKSNNASNKWLPALIGLAAVVAMPMALAQTAPTTDDAATQSAPPAGQSAAPTAVAPAQTQPKQVTWADLDADKDGSLSKTEVTAVPALSQVFDKADADKDGKLTAEEYKTFASKDSKGTSASGAAGGK